MAIRDQDSDDDSPYAVARRIIAERFEDKLSKREKGNTTVVERPIDQSNPEFSSFDEVGTGGGSRVDSTINPLADISDEELRKAYDRGESTGETTIHGYSYPLGDIAGELDRRYQVELRDEAEKNKPLEQGQLDLGPGLTKNPSLLDRINALPPEDEKAG